MAKIKQTYDELSAERKKLQKENEVPEWYTTQGYSLFKDNYAYKGETVRSRFSTIAKELAAFTNDPESHEKIFFELMWSGKLAPSTPVLANIGTPRGCAVSCAGNYIGDSISEFYQGYAEIAILSKLGFGTASYLGDIRHRGALIHSTGAAADGAVPVMDSCLMTSQKVSQGGTRRGAWAGYIEFSSEDFYEFLGYTEKNRASANLGINYRDKDINALLEGDPEAVDRFCEHMMLRAKTGKGYIWKPDHANRNTTQAIKNSGISIKGSQLCTEISLPCDSEHTFSCILSSLNLSLWDEITNDDIFYSLIFLDCVCSLFLKQAKEYGYKELEKVIRFTEKARALGLGALGFHTYLQEHMIPFESMEAHFINGVMFKRIKEQATIASKYLASLYGEPEWCKGTGMRNATLITIAPNMSSALLCGSVSQGIEPMVNNAFIQPTAGGEFVRYNPTLLKLMREKGLDPLPILRDIAKNHEGSVQHVDWLTDDEKAVFKTWCEIDQHAIIRLASARQHHIDQAQSLNVMFSSDESEEYVASVHKEFLLDDRLLSMYYMRSTRGNVASKGCVACEG